LPLDIQRSIGWLVDDLNACVRALAALGVGFEWFYGMEQDAGSHTVAIPEAATAVDLIREAAAAFVAN